jgi:hypothetical protein
MDAGEKIQDRNCFRIAGVLQLVVPSHGLVPADAPYPYQTVGPGRHEAGRDCDTNGGIAVLCDGSRRSRRRSSSFPCTPSIHTGSSSRESSPWRGQESQFVGRSGQGQSRRFQSVIFFRMVFSKCGRLRRSNPTEQVRSGTFDNVSDKRLIRRGLSSSLWLHRRFVSCTRSNRHVQVRIPGIIAESREADPLICAEGDREKGGLHAARTDGLCCHLLQIEGQIAVQLPVEEEIAEVSERVARVLQVVLAADQRPQPGL